MSDPASPPEQLDRAPDPTDIKIIHYHEEAFNENIESLSGYATIRLQERLGPHRQYEILRKLGFGAFSTTWLARDHLAGRYVAIKCLTAHGTALHEASAAPGRGDRTSEVSIHSRISQPTEDERARRCLQLLGFFTEQRDAHLDPFCYRGVSEQAVVPGAREADEHTSPAPSGPGVHPHLCLVTEVAGQTLKTFARAEYEGPGLPVLHAKHVVREVLLGLDYLHRECGVVHTDLKLDNVLVGYAPGLTNYIIQKTQEYGPNVTYEPRTVMGDVDITVRSILLRLPRRRMLNVFDTTIKIADFGQAQWLSRVDNATVQPLSLRAPEVILGCPWNEKIDIWSIGCLAYELLVGHTLAYPEPGIFTEDEALSVIIQLKGITEYPAHLLKQAVLATRHLTTDGSLRMAPESPPLVQPLEHALASHHAAPVNAAAAREEFAKTLAFIDRCLTLDPSARPSAAELLHDPWLQYEPLPTKWL